MLSDVVTPDKGVRINGTRLLKSTSPKPCRVSCRAVDSSNAPEWPQPIFALLFLSYGHSRSVLDIVETPN